MIRRACGNHKKYIKILSLLSLQIIFIFYHTNNLIKMSSRKNSSNDGINSESSIQEDEDDEEEEEWEDEQVEDENLEFFPICSPSQPQKTLLKALEHDNANFSFNLLDFLPSIEDEDFFEKTIIRINKSRLFVQKALLDNTDDVGGRLREYLKYEHEKQAFADDNNDDDDDGRYFKPVLEDDNMIMCMDDLQDIIRSKINTNVSVEQGNNHNHKYNHDDQNVNEAESVIQLKLKIQALEEQLHHAKEYITKLADVNRDDENGSLDSQEGKEKKRDNDTYYFSSYSHSSIHETMLQDTIRTEAYQNAILSNKHLFENKVVMDIGCGTGILSLFAAQAGAKKVIAIDASDVHVQAKEIVDLNGFSNVITVLHGKVEDLIENKLLPLDDGEKVDVVISEWMGYALLYETMLPSVLTARDHFMDRKKGTMWPNKSNMFIEGASDSRLDYWDDVYGMNMRPMKVKVINELRKEASVEIVDKEKVVTNRFELISFDLNICNDENLDYATSFELKPASGDEAVRIDKLVISFDVEFDLPGCNSIFFSTSCQTKPTHWKQTSLWFDPDDAPSLKSGEVLKGTFAMNRNDVNQRDMDFLVTWEIGLDDSDFKPRGRGTILSRLSS